jgi:hypothetical protein
MEVVEVLKDSQLLTCLGQGNNRLSKGLLPLSIELRVAAF